jgi:hypothetical protein
MRDHAKGLSCCPADHLCSGASYLGSTPKQKLSMLSDGTKQYSPGGRAAGMSFQRPSFNNPALNEIVFQ